MNRTLPAFLVSIALHLGLLALAYLNLTFSKEVVLTSSVPVEIITDMPSYEQAEAPVDPLAVKTPSPVPPPEEPVRPEPPKPDPAPKTPAPKPQQANTRTPPKPNKPTPDTNGRQRSQPQKPNNSFLDDVVDSTPSTAPTRTPAQANTRRTDGNSARGQAPQDAGPALNALARRLQGLWTPTCDLPGARDVKPQIRFRLSSGGRIVEGPEWVNRRNDRLWEAGAARAKDAVVKGQPYDDLPDVLYDRSLVVTFDADKACQ